MRGAADIGRQFTKIPSGIFVPRSADVDGGVRANEKAIPLCHVSTVVGTPQTATVQFSVDVADPRFFGHLSVGFEPKDQSDIGANITGQTWTVYAQRRNPITKQVIDTRPGTPVLNGVALPDAYEFSTGVARVRGSCSLAYTGVAAIGTWWLVVGLWPTSPITDDELRAVMAKVDLQALRGDAPTLRPAS